MSDPVSQSEVEDVLSSVRRFVGEARPNRLAAGPRGSGERFVLTPQLRVTENDVLVLQPENAVEPATESRKLGEPRLKEVGNEARDADEGKQEPLLLENAVASKPVARRTDVTELTAKIAALETAIAKTVDQWEPDGAGRDAYAGRKMPAMEWPCDVELDATGKPMKPPSDIVMKAAGEREAATADEPIVDEELLRQIVSEIVRAELQGTLGERITRNVRKLVRREIHRALVTKSLE